MVGSWEAGGIPFDIVSGSCEGAWMQADEVRKVQAEAEEHNRAILQLAGAVQEAGHGVDDAPPGAAASILMHHEALLRNKRCLLAYQNERCKRIRTMRWRLGSKFFSESALGSMSAAERRFLDDYDEALRGFMQSATGGLQLSLSLDPSPPAEHKVEVRVLKPFGKVATADGEVRLEPGSLHFLWREDAQWLQARGIAVISDSSPL